MASNCTEERKQIRILESVIASRDLTITAMDRHVTALKKQGAERDAKIERLEADVKRREDAINRLEAMLKVAYDTIDRDCDTLHELRMQLYQSREGHWQYRARAVVAAAAGLQEMMM